jgi:hypothetical protein
MQMLRAQLDAVAPADATIVLEAAPGTIEPLNELVEQAFATA